jgi:hypothetical protein
MCYRVDGDRSAYGFTETRHCPKHNPETRKVWDRALSSRVAPARDEAAIARAIVNHVGASLAEELKARGVDPWLIVDARQATNDGCDAFAAALVADGAGRDDATAGDDA